ncbi:MAG: hypothetical protein NVS2B4_14850 [Ramlibacter sp.]
MREIDKAVPPELDIHCIVDNYATHNHPEVKAWLTARPHWHMHFIPTCGSWLNQLERFFDHGQVNPARLIQQRQSTGAYASIIS